MQVGVSTDFNTRQAGAASTIYMIVMLVIMFALMYFLMIRPQKKEQKRVTAMLNDMEVGDAIVTTGVSTELSSISPMKM